MKIKIRYSFFRSLIYITLIMICWFLFIFALIFDIKKGVSQNTYIGGSIAFIMFCTISLIIYSYALKYTLRRYTLDEESISFRKNKQRKVLFWKDVIRIYESNKIPSYLTDTTEGFIIEYIEGGILKFVYLIKSKKITYFLHYLKTEKIIDID